MDVSVSNSGVSGYFLLLLCFIEILFVNVNSVDPDKILRSGVSDLGLHCFIGLDKIWYHLFIFLISP